MWQLIAHVLGCGWFFLADINSLDRVTWAHKFHLFDPSTEMSTQYITSLYWAFVTVRCPPSLPVPSLLPRLSA